MSQIITVTFAEGQREAIAAQPLEQWAYGQTLQFEGLDLPQAYRVDFSNFEYCGASIPRVGGPDGVAVPVEVLTSGRNVYAFIWVQDETSGARYRRATVRVVPGPEPDTDESPEEQSAVTEAINALNAAAEAIPAVVDQAVQDAIAKGDFSGAFWAEYGVTTGDEIDEALEDGKVILLDNSGLVFQLVGKLPTAPQNTFLFTTFTGDAYFALSVKGTTWSIVGQGSVAHLTSPNFGGTPTAPTAPAGTDSTQIATTEFVNAAIQAALEGFTPGQTISEELKQALLQLSRKVAYIDDQGETYYQDLYDALYPPAVLASIRATFAQGSTVIYNTDSLDVLKPLLTVTAVYDDGSTETVAAEDYTLSGTLATGVSTITASYQGKTATFQVTVTAAPMAFPVTNNLTGCSSSNSAAAVMENEPYSAVITPTAGYTLTGASVVITMAGQDITASAYSGGVISIPAVTGALVISVAAVEIVLSSITADYTQSSVVYNTDTLESLKANLVVTAAYSDGTSTVLAADAYTLSGTLAAGTSTITVSYQGKTATFYVVVTEQPTLSSISATYTQSGTVYDTANIDSLKADLVVTAVYSDSSTQTVPAADYTLSGTLTAGTSTITVNYGGKSTTFTVNVTHAVQKFSVTNSLTEVTNSNNAATVDEESTYSATLTANSGYVISSVSITMGGTDITTSVYSNGTISIASVTGDIVITAVAVEDVGWLPDVPYEIEWTDGYSLDTKTGDEKAYSTWSVSDFLPCDGLKNVNVAGTTGDGVFCYNANKEFLARISVSSANNTQLFPLRFDAKYIRTDKKTTNSQTVTPIILPVLGQGVAPDAGTIYSLSMIFGKTVWNSTGAETTSTNGKCSDFALCYGFSTITFSKKVRAFVAFYDANKAFLSSKATGTTNSSVTVPEGATYFRYDITGYSNEWPDVKLE